MKNFIFYIITNTHIDNVKIKNHEMNKIEIFRKNCFFFVAKKFNENFEKRKR